MQPLPVIPAVQVSVRHMVEFILRSGDINAAFFSANRALEGTRVHQQIQKRRKREAKEKKAVYAREVALEIEREHRGLLFQINGRADGLQRSDDNRQIILEEIKSTLMPLDKIEKNTDHWHWAQAKCYGYMYLSSLNIINETPPLFYIKLTYGHVESGEIKEFIHPFTLEELSEFFFNLLDRYWDYAKMDRDRLEERDETAKTLDFPFGAYRMGQRELSVSVFAAIKQKRKLFAQAPTGIGKTISTLFPAVKSLAEGFGEKIFYLTAKVIARQVAEEAFRDMHKKGLKLRSITLTAMSKICFNEIRICDPEHCEYARGHFDRVNAAILDIIRHEYIITRQLLEEYAKKHRVCPAEFQLDAAMFCDGIICDYNHAYDPKAKIQRFFQFGGDFILLNDEAHNLVDRAREMFSAGLNRSDFTALRKKLGRKHSQYKIMGLIAKEIRRQWEEPNQKPFCLEAHPADLLALLYEFAQGCEEILARGAQEPLLDELLSMFFTSLDYIRVSEVYDERYTFFVDPPNGHVRLYCIDPSHLLQQAQKKIRACIFFSATLTPLPYFRALLGGSFEDYTLKLASPFPKENLCLLTDSRISTRYKDRSQSYEHIAERLAAMVSAKTGNYFVFFPSYAYLDAVYTVFSDKYPDIKTLLQSQEMDDENRESYLAAFIDAPRESLLAFAVMGGVFSEGIDLKGERLSGTAIVGVGLPLICAERDVIRDYFNRYENSGFAFAYQYPGMNKVLQAAGRVIRTETDRGVVLLIDSRFGEAAYRELFPAEWERESGTKILNPAWLEARLRNFWLHK